MLEKELMKKSLVIYGIERSLIECGNGIQLLDKITEKLKDRYNCTIEKCYEKPEYLVVILSEEKPEIQSQIITAIKQKLSDFMYQESIALFVKALDEN